MFPAHLVMMSERDFLPRVSVYLSTLGALIISQNGMDQRAYLAEVPVHVPFRHLFAVKIMHIYLVHVFIIIFGIEFPIVGGAIVSAAYLLVH